MSKVLGIIGGFGPAVTGGFLNILNRKLRRAHSEGRIEVLVHYYPEYPEERLVLAQKAIDPVEELLKGARIMQSIGATYLAIPCIEAHYYVPVLRDKTSIPIIDALEAANEYVKRTCGKDRMVGILANTQAVQTGMFNKCFKDHRLLYPPGEIQQNLVMKALEGGNCSSGEDREIHSRKLLKHAAGYLIYMGVQVLVVGSADISAVLRQEHVGIYMIDPIEVLTERIVEILTV